MIIQQGPYTRDEITPQLLVEIAPAGWAGLFLSLLDRNMIYSYMKDADKYKASELAAMFGMNYPQLRQKLETEVLKRELDSTNSPKATSISIEPIVDIRVYAKAVGRHQTFDEVQKMLIDAVVKKNEIYINFIINPKYTEVDNKRKVARLIETDSLPLFEMKENVVVRTIKDAYETIATMLGLKPKQRSRMKSNIEATKVTVKNEPKMSDFSSKTKYVESLIAFKIDNNQKIVNKDIAKETGLSPKTVSAIKSYMRKRYE